MDIEKYACVAPQYYDQKIPPLLEEILAGNDKRTLLECGCGDGSLLYALAKKGYLEHMNLLAVDLSKNRVKLVKEIDNRISVQLDNVENLDTIRTNSVDVLVSTQVIEHVNDRKMIDSVYRVTRPNGKIYITTVYKKWYAWYFYRNKDGWVLDPTHLREYKCDEELFRWIKPDRFKILSNEKSLQWFPVIDFFVKRFSINNRELYNSSFFSAIRRLKIPILGYYNWELVLQKV